MNNVTATIGLVQLQVIDALLSKHINNGLYYDQQFANTPGINFAKCDAHGKSSYWLYTLLSDHASDIEKALNASGILASKLARPNNLHSIFRDANKPLPGLDNFYRRLLHVPCGWWVTEEERQQIVDIVKKG
jgi:perosamine synthetase